MKYRREIDGLRAVAVVPVILFHAGLPLFAGGYVGVDVFFVISGFLITGILLEEMQQGRFSLLRFYERRARRILPALFFVMLASLACAWAWLMPREMKEFSQSLVAVPLFVSNVLFWRTSGYFDTAAELKPLLHTWSLAVEEQYYLLFPLLLLATWRWGRSRLLVLAIAAGLASLAWATWWSGARPLAAFYLLPTRAWELLLGVGLALHTMERIGPAAGLRNEIGGALGVAMMLAAVFAFDRQTPFPGVYALVPTVGCALVILCASPATFAGRVLGSRLLVGVGLISYSAYLWHQPLFAFARSKLAHLPGPGLMLALSAASLLLAGLTWAFVEKPFRGESRLGRRAVFGGALAGMIFFVALGAGGIATDGYRVRLDFPPNVQWMSLADRLETQGDVCDVQPDPRYPGISTCEFGDTQSRRTVVLYGDSHAQAISRELDIRMAKDGYKVVKVDLVRCGIVFDVTATPGPNPRQHFDMCNAKFAQLQRLVKDQAASVLLVTRWTFQFFPLPGELESLQFDNGEGGVDGTSYRENVAIAADGSTSIGATPKKAATKKLLDGLAASASTLYVAAPIPEVGWDMFKTNVEHFRQQGQVLQELSFAYPRYLQRNRFILDILDESARSNANLVLLRPDHSFCQSLVPGRCVAQHGGVPLYYDGDHLADEGARFVVDEFAQQLARRRGG